MEKRSSGAKASVTSIDFTRGVKTPVSLRYVFFTASGAIQYRAYCGDVGRLLDNAIS
jgi:hypothetical protein